MRPGRAVGATFAALMIGCGLTACTGDFVSPEEQSRRQQSAAAFGALEVEIREVQGLDFPGPKDPTAVNEWVAVSVTELGHANERFGVWQARAGELSFSPREAIGPTEEQIGTFNSAYAKWSAAQASYERGIRRCARNKKAAVSRRCMNDIQVSSAPTRVEADAALSEQIRVITLSMTATATKTSDSTQSN